MSGSEQAPTFEGFLATLEKEKYTVSHLNWLYNRYFSKYTSTEDFLDLQEISDNFDFATMESPYVQIIILIKKKKL